MRGLPTGQVEEDLWGHVDIVQEELHENELIAVIQGQVDLQHQLLAAQEGHIQQNDVKVAELAARVGIMGGPGASLSQLAAMGPLWAVPSRRYTTWRHQPLKNFFFDKKTKKVQTFRTRRLCVNA